MGCMVLCDCDQAPVLHHHKPARINEYLPLSVDLTNEEYREDLRPATPAELNAWEDDGGR